MKTVWVMLVGFVSTQVFAADVTGKVNFTGKAPATPVIKMNSDPNCAKENHGKTHTKQDVVVNSNKTLQYVFVYLKEGVKEKPAAPTEPVVFDQKGCFYEPHVFGIQVGQPLKIVNSDPTMHNVNALAKSNPKFNIGMPTKGQTAEKKFTKPETMVRIKCDVHGWMNAYAGVLDHPYFAVSDDKGNFTIKNVPPGEYTVEAWQEKLGTKTGKVTVAASGPATLDFTF